MADIDQTTAPPAQARSGESRRQTDVVKLTEAGILKGDRFFLTFAEVDGGKVSLAFPSDLTTLILTAIRATQRAHAKLPKPQPRDLSKVPPLQKATVNTDALGDGVIMAMTTQQGLELTVRLTPEMAGQLGNTLLQASRTCADQQTPGHPHEVN